MEGDIIIGGNRKQKKALLTGVVIFVLVVALMMWGMPNYKVYARELSGKAELREAEWNRQIAVEEARQ